MSNHLCFILIHGSSIFSFMMTVHNGFHSTCTGSYSHKQCMTITLSSHLHQHLSSIFFDGHSDCSQLELPCWFNLLLPDLQGTVIFKIYLSAGKCSSRSGILYLLIQEHSPRPTATIFMSSVLPTCQRSQQLGLLTTDILLQKEKHRQP